MSDRIFRRPYRNIWELQRQAPYKLEPEPHRHVLDTNLLYIDEESVRKKLEASGRRYTSGRADTWLKFCGSVLSTAQLEADFNAGPIDVGVSCTGYRPPRYGRAAIFESREFYDGASATDCADALLVDVKGCGVRVGMKPLATKNESGLLPLHLALAEVINSRILNHIFDAHGISVRCVPILGIVELGFTALTSEGQIPAVTLVRQVHMRPDENNELPKFGSVEARVKQEIEELLFQEGITSTGYSNVITITFEDSSLVVRVGGEKREIPQHFVRRILEEKCLSPPLICFPTNVQLANEPSVSPLQAEIVDLSHYKSFTPSPSFVATLVDDRPFNFGEMIVRTPNFPRKLHGALNTKALGDNSLLNDGRFDQISRRLGWTDVDVKVSAVMIEALYITSLAVSDRLKPQEVKCLIDSFLESVLI